MKTKNLEPLLLLFFAAALISGCAKKGAEFPDPFTQNERLARGINVMSGDPIWEDMDSARFKAEYFRMLRDAGFSSIRFNLHGFRHMDPENDYRLDEEWIEVFEWGIDRALENGLMVILDLHEHNSLGRELERWKPYFLPFWEQIASRYRDLPPEVIFELLNEPGRQITPEIWNELMNDAIAVIRKTNPNRTIVTGPAYWYQRFQYLDSLKLPEDDRNIIITVHYYQPHLFTHQSAPWMAHSRDTIGILWSGYPEERNEIMDDFRQVQEWAERNERPILLGEFGAYDSADTWSRVEWTNFVTRSAEKLGWSWTYWQFDRDFILYDIDRESWYTPIFDALIPKEDKPYHREESVMAGGKERRFIVQLPSRQSGEDLPAVICFHDTGKLPEDIKRWSQLDTVAAEEHFIVVYPEALQPELSWQPETDTALVRSIIEKLIADHGVDPQRIYAAGFSEGGKMASSLGFHNTDLIRAAASVQPIPGGEGTYPVLGADIPVQITLIHDNMEIFSPAQVIWGMEAARVIWDQLKTTQIED